MKGATEMHRLKLPADFKPSLNITYPPLQLPMPESFLYCNYYMLQRTLLIMVVFQELMREARASQASLVAE